ncbi:hypothetical protein COCCADRAFT_99053 [Bipolaris zeicola 26-R-13]|uniref:Uncharacterized protein n=1 Tax=Cochliobolus carbonum (strain 26-R-13) TaxID=930089 RepID=W6XXV5_COCC2|nr:uncharacterized protein COCCADRAFT_99053 [Bipolaris zeicola 26-R-13]EUC32277.1 hypothetical protein COCCADRAFT_99053 [Bipolaris zeicola 26-R-13]
MCRDLSYIEKEQLRRTYTRRCFAYCAPSHRPERLSSAGSYYTASSSHYKSQGEMRSISGNFNAPTEIEVERQRSHSKRSRGMGKTFTTKI